MDGSATFTIVWSRMIISIPTQSTTSAIQRSRSAPGEAVCTLVLEVIVRSFRDGNGWTVADCLVRDDLARIEMSACGLVNAACDGVGDARPRLRRTVARRARRGAAT